MSAAVAERRPGATLSYAQRMLARQASAHALLLPNGGHQLHVTVRHVELVVDRDRAAALAEAIDRVGEADALALMGVFKPGLKASDVAVLRRALAAFAEEVAVEDRSGAERTHRAMKALEI